MSRDPHRPAVLLATLAVPLALAWGLWAMWPFILREHVRMEPWKRPWHWIGDVVALVAFLRFLVRRRAGEAAPRAAPPAAGMRGLLVALLAGLVLEGAATALLFRDEVVDHGRATAATATLLGVDRKVARAGTDHRLRVAFRDATGTPREATVSVYVPRSRPVPPPVDVGVDGGRGTPRTVAIRYAPRWPCRAWLEGAPPVHDNHFAWLSLFVLFFQTLVQLVLVLLARGAGEGAAPYVRIHWLVPLGTEAFILAAFGTIDVAMGWR